MSNAEQAWKEWSKERVEQRDLLFYSTSAQAFMQYGFLAGYARGRADAQELPEVRAEELVVGEIYRYRGISSWFPVRVIAMFEECVRLEEFGVHGYADIPFKSSQNKFRGPLPLGGGE